MKTLNLIATILFALGASGLGGCVWWVNSIQDFKSHAQSATGTVIGHQLRRSNNGGTTYAPEVSYIGLDGGRHTFVSSVSTKPRSHDIGDQVQVLIDTRNPNDARLATTSGLWLGPIILAILSGSFTLMGGGLLLWRLQSARRRRWLQRHGQRVEARIVNVGANTSIRINGRHPWQIQCQWQEPRSGKIYRYASDNIDYDPASYLQGEAITVLIAPGNPKRYWVDTSALPEPA
ncbi:MAG: DUF3592 domain-containing protein [Gammaproteobacteria bacterium]|nr:DUF3592 domain-containing protein [Gammaproteobacteria bacterium]